MLEIFTLGTIVKSYTATQNKSEDSLPGMVLDLIQCANTALLTDSALKYLYILRKHASVHKT